jgi:hypothetical protein
VTEFLFEERLIIVPRVCLRIVNRLFTDSAVDVYAPYFILYHPANKKQKRIKIIKNINIPFFQIGPGRSVDSIFKSKVFINASIGVKKESIILLIECEFLLGSTAIF